MRLTMADSEPLNRNRSFTILAMTRQMILVARPLIQRQQGEAKRIWRIVEGCFGFNDNNPEIARPQKIVYLLIAPDHYRMQLTNDGILDSYFQAFVQGARNYPMVERVWDTVWYHIPTRTERESHTEYTLTIQDLQTAKDSPVQLPDGIDRIAKGYPVVVLLYKTKTDSNATIQQGLRLLSPLTGPDTPARSLNEG